MNSPLSSKNCRKYIAGANWPYRTRFKCRYGADLPFFQNQSAKRTTLDYHDIAPDSDAIRFAASSSLSFEPSFLASLRLRT